MAITLPLAEMTIHEKLLTMEAIWEDLTRNVGEYESPAWHETVLRVREERIKLGLENSIDWETAKRELRHLQK